MFQSHNNIIFGSRSNIDWVYAWIVLTEHRLLSDRHKTGLDSVVEKQSTAFVLLSKELA